MRRAGRRGAAEKTIPDGEKSQRKDTFTKDAKVRLKKGGGGECPKVLWVRVRRGWGKRNPTLSKKHVGEECSLRG